MYNQQQGWTPSRPGDDNGFNSRPQSDTVSRTQVIYNLPFLPSQHQQEMGVWTSQPRAEQFTAFPGNPCNIVYPATSNSLPISDLQPHPYSPGSNAWSGTLRASPPFTGLNMASDDSPELSSYSTFSVGHSPRTIKMEGPPEWVQPQQHYVLPSLSSYPEEPTIAPYHETSTPSPDTDRTDNTDTQPDPEDDSILSPSHESKQTTDRDARETKISLALHHHLNRQKRVMTTEDNAKHHCPNCGKGFRRIYNLRSHETKHLASRTKVQCGHASCGRLFDRKTDLTRHERSVHLGKKDQQCPLCDSCFSRKDTLVRHIEGSCAKRIGLTKKKLNSLITPLRAGTVNTKL